MEHRQPVMLLGAGASKKSGIPDAWETVNRAAKWAWCKEHGRSILDLSVVSSDWQPWLESRPWFQNGVGLADQYPVAIDNLLGIADDRREFFEDLIHPGVSPSEGYHALARIMGNGWVATVLTTNFDHCLHRAAILTNQPHHIVEIRTPSDWTRFSVSPSHPQLVHLHGSVEHYSDMNLAKDVETLNKEIVEALRPLLRDRPLIVIGYRGMEASIMNDLLFDQCEYTNNFSRGVFWCDMKRSADRALSPLTQRLADRIGSNFNRVQIENFDHLLKVELLDQLLAAKVPPKSLGPVISSAGLPPDMRAFEEGVYAELDQALLYSRLKKYADKRGEASPDRFEAEWNEETAEAYSLVQTDPSGTTKPTMAGWLMFARNPTAKIAHAKVRLLIKGPEIWLRGAFGDDADLFDTDEEFEFAVKREIGGTLWDQLTVLIETTSLLNQPFVLKEAKSRHVMPYHPQALKEMIVNALVHRDYQLKEPIDILMTPEKRVLAVHLLDRRNAQSWWVRSKRSRPRRVVKKSKCGLVGKTTWWSSGIIDVRELSHRWHGRFATNARQSSSDSTAHSRRFLEVVNTAQSFFPTSEQEPAATALNVKGYRNPVVSDLFYGGSEMDRKGSGLSDMWRKTCDNNGNVTFGPTEENAQFRVVISARPEAVDEITRTAVADQSETVRFTTNIAEFVSLPDRIWHAGTTEKSASNLRNNVGDLPVPPGYVHDGRFFSFYDLMQLSTTLVTPFDEGDIEELTIDELLEQSNGLNMLRKLLHDCINEHLRAVGLIVDESRRRAHFPRGEERNRKITYQGRVKRATRTIVKARTKRDSDEIVYFEHKAFTYLLMHFDVDWGLLINPGYVFTRDGHRNYIGRERTNVLSTKRAARDFNTNVLHDVAFWMAHLSDEADGVFALRTEATNSLSDFAPTILLNSVLPGIAFSSSVFDLGYSLDDELDDALSAVDYEIENLITQGDDDNAYNISDESEVDEEEN